MENLPAKINAIKNKTGKLVSLYKDIRSENEVLKATFSESSKKITEQQAQIKNLQDEIKTLKLSKFIAKPNDTHDIKLKINELVREVDKCLALINN